MKFSEQLKAGVILDNPIFMQTIGLCPALATTTSLSNAIGMGVAATVVLICSNVVISALRKFIPDKIRIACFITIIATFVTMIDLALQAADRIAVFYAGTTVEVCPASDFEKGKGALRHPYSKAFLDALPQNEFKPIAGTQPYAGKLPSGCLFADRCPKRTESCGAQIEMRALRGGKVRCVHAT